MQQIKIFEGHGNNEDDVNSWLREHPEVEIIGINMVPMHDRYTYGAGDICNQWVATIVIYEEEQKCRVCGCTWDHACPGGCYWVEPDLCSKCAEKLQRKEEPQNDEQKQD
ncbi:MAG: hypothetical protein PHE09_14900 [Oscillospiraceae bacterium]|nr:hypothetical protein [Oscillospiraceae bacterium]